MLPGERASRRERQRRAATAVGCGCVLVLFAAAALVSQTLRGLSVDGDEEAWPTTVVFPAGNETARGASGQDTVAPASVTPSGTGSPSVTAAATRSPSGSAASSATATPSCTPSASLNAFVAGSATPSLSGTATASGTGSRSWTPTRSPTPSQPDSALQGLCEWLSPEQARVRATATGCEQTFYDGAEHGVGGARCPPGYATNASAVPEEQAHCRGDWPLALSQHGGRPAWDAPFRVAGCTLDWYTPRQACAIFEQAGQVIMEGDSLTRHLAQALIAVLRGDYHRGAMMHHAGPECTCEAQFDDARKCRDASAGFWAEHSHPPAGICPGWRRQHLVLLTEWEGYESARLQRYLDDPAFAGNRSLLYVSLGLHQLSIPGAPMSSDDITARYHQDMLRRLAARNALSPARAASQPDRLIVGTTTPPGPNKPLRFVATQGMPIMAAHAAAMRRFQAATPGTLLFDSFVLMQNLSSYDGTHFLMGPNVVAAQAFLNTLVKGLGDIRVPPPFADDR